MKLSSLLFAAAGAFCFFAALMFFGSKDPTDKGFIDVLRWAGITCFIVGGIMESARIFRSNRTVHEMRHRLDEADEYRHSGVRR
jgi:hypothetical protein